jgi:hypothetical protein
MHHQRTELTLKNAFADPLVRTLMAADGVDPKELRIMLNEIVSALDRRSNDQPQHQQLQRHQPQRYEALGATNCA